MQTTPQHKTNTAMARRFIRESGARACPTLHHRKHSHHSSSLRRSVTCESAREAFGTMAEFPCSQSAKQYLSVWRRQIRAAGICYGALVDPGLS